MRTVLCAAVAACCLTGCAAIGDLTGAVVGFVSGAVTGNPAIGIGVGIVVRAGTNELVDRVTRTRKSNEQDAIAAVVAGLNTGESGFWAVDQRMVGDAQGEVRVIRVIQTPLATCKELLFSVVSDNDARWFTTTACQQGDRWKWAAAEPAVSRWSSLQ